MSQAEILVRKDPPIAWLILNRPEKMNAFNTAMWTALPLHLAELEADPAIRVIVVRGVDERVFSGGADITEFQKQADPSSNEDRSDPILHAFEAFARCPKPTIAMIHGVCMGGGCALALNMDIRLAATDATFAITPARLGLGYSFRGIERAVQELGPANTRYLFITASAIPAQKALEMGIVQEVHLPSKLEEATVVLAQRIAANAPMTLRAIKESVRQAVLDPAHRDLETITAQIASCFRSQDFQEGVQAFIEKRKPEFRDR